ncbi:neurotrimin-like isoform X2 [Cylas formicarius]|uniref:neurotrimin-like isoform X2 n=1 Tax=Cylas formicarius TaxID=197179 RepID=UPI002958D4D1|nr:neurotrimin-like isoform X2 [Cylas formicarius]
MASARNQDVFAVFTFAIFSLVITARTLESPNFSQPIRNITVPVGREAVLECAVQNLNPYKVAWLRVDTQTILTIHSHVITKNHRIGVTHSELKTWYLHIKDVRHSDKGWYMCQINTDPMKSQVGYLDVVVPPDILDYPTSADMLVDENLNATLRCVATGSPDPTITWKREDGQMIRLSNGTEVSSTQGDTLNFTKVRREQMGPYLCIASNGIPPTVSKRIFLHVQFPPSIWIQYQLIGGYDGQKITLECHSQAFPKSINYWTKDSGEIIPHSGKYVPEIIGDNYKVHMKLTINYLGPDDYGIYKCVSKNSLGDMEGSVNVYKIPHPNIVIPVRNKSATHEKATDLTYSIRNAGPGKDESSELHSKELEYHSSGRRFRTIWHRDIATGTLGLSLFVHLSFTL